MRLEKPFSALSIAECQLCGAEPTDEDSHIIPRLISKALIKIKAGGHHRFRFTDNPNTIQQDTLSLPFLGKNCEDLFGKYETHFAPKYRKYLLNKSSPLEIDEDSYRLLVSISWRTAKLLLHTLPPEQGEHLKAPEEFWKEYLLQRRSDVGQHHLYLFSARDFKDSEIQASQRLTKTHLNNVIGMHVNGFYGTAQIKHALINNLGPLILCGQLRNLKAGTPSETQSWNDFLIKPGTVIPSTARDLPPGVVEAIDEQITWTANKIDSMSEVQKQKQKAFADRHLKNTPLYELVEEDKRLFPSDAE
ncbi:MAG: hypothetical protein L0G82_09635 [Pseudomonas sp.]|nr:hypothetical protein [Pseudomonas sp.]